MDRIHVASFLPVPEHGIEAIKAVDPRIELHMISQNFARYIRDPEHPEVDAEAARAESAAIRARDEVWLCFWFGDMGADAPALKWVALGGAGADHILRGPLDDHVQITNMSGLAARVMAEWVIGFMLIDCKGFRSHIENQRNARWLRAWEGFGGAPGTLEGATVGIIGYGAIGSEVAQLCDGFGADVIGTRRTASPDGAPPDGAPACVRAIWTPDRLHDVLAQSDYVVLGVPLTEATRELIGAEEIAAMKPGAALINIARGSVVDWDAMIRALKNGELRASYTDVTSPEPLPDGHPDWSVPGLMITPHTSGLQDDYMGKAAKRFAANLRRYIDGEPLHDIVDRAAGY